VAQVKINGEPKIVVLDWKTSNAFHSEYAMQIAAYTKAYEEMFQLPVHTASIVRPLSSLLSSLLLVLVSSLSSKFPSSASSLFRYAWTNSQNAGSPRKYGTLRKPTEAS
jgi:hypothetical protein